MTKLIKLFPFLFAIVLVACENVDIIQKKEDLFLKKHQNFDFAFFGNNIIFELQEMKNGRKVVVVCKESENCSYCYYNYLEKYSSEIDSIKHNGICPIDTMNNKIQIKKFIELEVKKLKIWKSNVFINTTNLEYYHLMKLENKDSLENGQKNKYAKHVRGYWYSSN